MINKFRGLICLFSLVCISVQAADPSKAAIASAHPLATRAGLEILRQGGNAFDAAIAVGAALAVVEPAGSGLGGGGFFLIHSAAGAKQIILDARERAPLAARRDMFLDDSKQPIEGISINGPLSAGIPGIPAAIDYLAKRFGRLPLTRSLTPAIHLARNGFEVDARYLSLVGFRAEILGNNPAASKIFLDNGRIPKPGFKLVQKDLAKTLETIANTGKEGFYHGGVARKLVNGVRAAGGAWSLRDLEDYRVVARKPIVGSYKGISITSAAPPSSGGVVLMEALNILAGYDLEAVKRTDRVHLIVEAMRRAYADRALYLGDPDFIRMPLERLLSKNYAARQRQSIQPDRATPSEELNADLVAKTAESEGRNTTHYSILDGDGNRVAATLSINYPFGSGFVAPDTGVLLNDEMDDFSSSPGLPNVYGLVGNEANSIKAGKRMLSSMTPTFLEDPQRVAILGTPGGSRIISMVLLAILDFAQGHGPDSWVSVPRFHHQFLPDVIQYEKNALNQAEINGLKAKGHILKESSRLYGNMQAILWDKQKNRVSAASDHRGVGFSLVRN